MRFLIEKCLTLNLIGICKRFLNRLVAKRHIRSNIQYMFAVEAPFQFFYLSVTHIFRWCERNVDLRQRQTHTFCCCCCCCSSFRLKPMQFSLIHSVAAVPRFKCRIIGRMNCLAFSNNLMRWIAWELFREYLKCDFFSFYHILHSCACGDCGPEKFEKSHLLSD